MIFNIEEQPQGILSTVSGRLDTPAAVKAQQEIAPLLEHADQVITLDCKDLEYISSSGLRLFLTIRKEAAAKGNQVLVMVHHPIMPHYYYQNNDHCRNSCL